MYIFVPLLTTFLDKLKYMITLSRVVLELQGMMY